MANKQQNGMVGFGQAIKNFFAGYVDFTGKSTRAEYWWVVLATVLAYFCIAMFGAMITFVMGVVGAVLMGILVVCAGLGIVLPYIALITRRFHDVGLSSWLYWGPYLAYMVMVFMGQLMILAGADGVGAAFAAIGAIIGVVTGVFGLVVTLLPSNFVGDNLKK